MTQLERKAEDTPPKRKANANVASNQAREKDAPRSFLDHDWSWSSPSTWPLSIRFLPFPMVSIVLFFGVYVQHFMSSDVQAFDYGTPIAEDVQAFDYGIPIAKVEKLATDSATHDWEHGTAAEALLELHDPKFSVFSHQPIKGQDPAVLQTKAMKYILPKIQTGHITLSNNAFSVADPCSLGVFAIMAAQVEKWTNDGLSGRPYMTAYERQERFIMTEAPRYEINGAISHRLEVAELWSDAIFMFPPFLAYGGTIDQGTSGTGFFLIKHALQQIESYRDVLMIEEGETKGAWKHIVGPSEMADTGAWSTGNGWAAYGIARVRATLVGWEKGANLLHKEMRELDGWMAEIIDAAIRTDDHESGLLRNYLGDETWFGETAGTALLAASAYRLAVFLEPGEQRKKYAAWAATKREAVWAHIDAEGVAKPAVNSLKHLQREPHDGPNPEGQSFLLLLAAAWRDCVQAVVCER